MSLVLFLIIAWSAFFITWLTAVDLAAVLAGITNADPDLIIPHILGAVLGLIWLSLIPRMFRKNVSKTGDHSKDSERTG